MTAITRHNPLEINPLWQKGLRSRCRLKHLATWGVIWFTLALFVFLITFSVLTEQGITSISDAAKVSLPGVLVVQAVILMIFGTGAVAAGISQERDEGLLDYVRMTPMSPTAKIIGYLFGLPAREYVLVAMTMPIVAIIVVISDFSLVTLGQYYLVFFSSVLVYHMTALVVGMVSPKPRLASMMSMGLVLVLYLALPNFSRMGITFFEFLTIRPTWYGLIQQEMPESLRWSAELSGIDVFRPVPFFNGSVRPTVYTMLVQGFLIAALFSIVHRKWRDQSAHLFSKFGALVVFGGVAVFTVGSLWAVVAQDDAYNRLFDPLGYHTSTGRFPETFFFLLMTCLMILGGTYVFLISAITASKDRTLAGYRQSNKLGRERLGFNSDAASSLPVALVMLTITVLAGVAIMSMTLKHGDYIASAPSAVSMIAVVLTLLGIGLFVQGVVEGLSARVAGVAIFLCWIIPFFVMLIVSAAFNEFEMSMYIGQPCPPISLGFSIAWMLETTDAPMSYAGDFRFLPTGDEIRMTPPRIAAAGAMGYTLAATLVQLARWKRRSGLRRAI